MSNRRVAFLSIVCLLSMMLGPSLNFVTVLGWGNGGFTDSLLSPKYGTHDWIAQDGLDWLPLEGKQWILGDIANYLYGTELPDNGAAPDGIGDTLKHQVYYFANRSLQDDSSALRAQEEYNEAISLFQNGDSASSAKRLGAMTHYVCDVAVFGHVMGSKTDWGEETHHSDYENYVNARTSDYYDEFNTFLSFDGTLDNVSAYNATLTLAYDTTFDSDGDLTCVWMDQNYDWSNPIFKNRCGESLNVAINLVADVLHTFYIELMEDTNAPKIGIPSRVPESDAEPNQEVKVSVNVTDTEGRIKTVTLFYTINGGTTWENRTMNYNWSTNLYDAAIPGQEAGAFIRFRIVASDYAGNTAARDGTEPHWAYKVLPEFPSNIIWLFLMILTMSAVLYAKKHESKWLK